jgi:hypothetical protein
MDVAESAEPVKLPDTSLRHAASAAAPVARSKPDAPEVPSPPRPAAPRLQAATSKVSGEAGAHRDGAAASLASDDEPESEDGAGVGFRRSGKKGDVSGKKGASDRTSKQVPMDSAVRSSVSLSVPSRATAHGQLPHPHHCRSMDSLHSITPRLR